MSTTSLPDRSEAAEYYFTYIDQVTGTDICALLAAQGDETLAALRAIPEDRSLQRYAPGKWTLREVLGHLNDTERMFVFRAFWFARGFDTPLPSFDQDVAVAAAGSEARSWNSLIDEFQAVRGSTLSFFQNLPPEAWTRRGIASGNPFTVRALAFIAAGHVTHHMRIVRERYLARQR
jgi:uncharacterized damage-inducible protein DinB